MDNNIEVALSVSTLKIVEPELIRCFGYDHNDFADELSQLFLEKHIVVKDNKIVYPVDYDSCGRSQVEYSWIKGNGELVLLIPETSNTDLLVFLEPFFCRTDSNSVIMLTLFTLALLHYRNHRVYRNGYDCEVDDYYKYALSIRPDMLRLYSALHAKRNLNHAEVRISLKGNPPIRINNDDCWFEIALERYLNKYLGVKDLEEANAELKDIYGKKKGNVFANKIASEYMWGIYHLLEISDNKKLCTKGKKSVPRAVCRFIFDYLKLLGIVKIQPKSGLEEEEIDIMKSQLTYLLKRFKAINELKNDKIYKDSPNNRGFKRSVSGYY